MISPGIFKAYDIRGVVDSTLTIEAVRAIGAAVGQNAVAYLIPCHRVIRKTGRPGGYRWNEERKCAMLGWEAAKKTACQLSPARL